jgi:geranylgeranyl pyrophosphate synthase
VESALSHSVAATDWLVNDLLRVEDILLSSAGGSTNPLVAEASTHLVKAGGKRLRPALVLLASHAGEPGKPATDLAAAAIELVHLATLYHDDVLDESETRRGVPTVHAKWGVGVAILAGDYLFARGCSLGAEAGSEVPTLLSNGIANVCEGQISEFGALNNPARDVEEHLNTIFLKTASLFRCACEMGATTALARPEARASLAAYGANLGLAFQLIDDLLDITGDSDITGKAPGTDLKEGVFTLPVLIACERNPAFVRRLEEGERDLTQLLPLLRGSGAIDAAYERAVAYGRRAKDSVAFLPDGTVRSVLHTVVDGVLAQLD